MSYTVSERVEIVKMFYSGNSTRTVSALFSAKYPNRPIPSHTTIGRIITKFENTGTLLPLCKCNKNDQNIQINVFENENTTNVLSAVIENPRISSREIAQQFDMHNSTALKILKKNNFHSYKVQCHQELLEGDYERRAEFCYEMLERANADRKFLKNVCFTDECTFTLNNEPNVQNCRIWSTKRPEIVVETRTQYHQKINVWAGILGHHLIGPFFYEENLDSGRFLDLLQEEILPALAEVAPEEEEIWFQMDGCPAHNSREVKELVNNCFNNCVIGPNCLIKWPPRSGDLAPNDFYLWGDVKSKIYGTVRFPDLEALKTGIREECAKITPRILANVRREFYDRLGYCLAQNGGLFEHLL